MPIASPQGSLLVLYPGYFSLPGPAGFYSFPPALARAAESPGQLRTASTQIVRQETINDYNGSLKLGNAKAVKIEQRKALQKNA